MANICVAVSHMFSPIHVRVIVIAQYSEMRCALWQSSCGGVLSHLSNTDQIIFITKLVLRRIACSMYRATLTQRCNSESVPSRQALCNNENLPKRTASWYLLVSPASDTRSLKPIAIVRSWSDYSLVFFSDKFEYRRILILLNAQFDSCGGRFHRNYIFCRIFYMPGRSKPRGPHGPSSHGI